MPAPSVTYTAKRRVASGHSASTSYTMDIATARCTEEWQDNKREIPTKSDEMEVLYYNTETYWNYVSRQITIADLTTDYWYEFLASVAGGEVFQFDRHGSTASPNNPVNMKIIGTPVFTPDDSDQYVSISFKMREV